MDKSAAENKASDKAPLYYSLARQENTRSGLAPHSNGILHYKLIHGLCRMRHVDPSLSRL